MKRSEPAPLALTQGDPSGIGPDVTLLAWRDRTVRTPPFFVLADPNSLAARAARLGLQVPIEVCQAEAANHLFASKLPVVPLRSSVAGRPGDPTAADAAATIESIESAVEHARNGTASAVVTNPISKDVLYQAGFAHPGHTEFLAVLAARNWGGTPPRAVMMLWSEMLVVVPVTIHIALAAVPGTLTRTLIEDTVVIVDRDLRERFGVEAPRLACAGLNPHAGEAGAMGREEIEIVTPALDRLRSRGIDITGPSPADTLFTASGRSGYDAAIAMYHDQALIPIKTLAFDEAINVTLGLPFIRTSPDHGTAFDIAGTGLARPASLQAALGLAARLAHGGGTAGAMVDV